MVNNYSVPWCFTNHAGHEKGAFFPFPEDEQQRKTLLGFLNRSDAHRVLILNRGSMFAFQWREFSPPLILNEQQRKTLLRFLNRSDAHRVIILNRGSMFAFQWREYFPPPLSFAHRLLQCYHRQKRDRRSCNSRGIPPQPSATRAISQWARSLEWRHGVTLPNLVGKICISFFLFYCEGMLSLVVLWLCGDAQEFKACDQ